MALPLSGEISMYDIQVELGIGEGDPGFSDFGLSEARNGTYVAINPCSTYKPPSTGQISLSDWYGYNQTQACPPAYNIYTMDRYECDTPSGPCSYVETISVANTAVISGYGKFYLDNIYGYIFNLVTTGGAGPWLIIDVSGNGTNNCNSLCSV